MAVHYLLRMMVQGFKLELMSVPLFLSPSPYQAPLLSSVPPPIRPLLSSLPPPIRPLLSSEPTQACSSLPHLKPPPLSQSGPFSPRAELTNGRAAMLGFAVLCALEYTAGVSFF